MDVAQPLPLVWHRAAARAQAMRAALLVANEQYKTSGERFQWNVVCMGDGSRVPRAPAIRGKTPQWTVHIPGDQHVELPIRARGGELKWHTWTPDKKRKRKQQPSVGRAPARTRTRAPSSK